MKTAENLTALLKSQEQTLRDAVSFAIETAQKSRSYRWSWRDKSEWFIGFNPSARDWKMLNLLTMGALGISVYLGQQKGNASTSDLSEEAIKNTVEAALAIAKYTSPDDCTG